MVSVKAYGKFNIALNIVGQKDGYHMLDTFVCTVDKYDKIILSKRKDKKILVSFSGKYAFTPKDQSTLNAYKSAQKFIEKFNTNGVNIEIVKNIPDGGGMGGSSTNISGVLNGLKKLYKIDGDVKDIADALGSDSGYLLDGGFARLTSRGEVVEKLDISAELYFVVLHAKNGVNTGECFKTFDEKGFDGVVCDINQVINAVSSGDVTSLKGQTLNALTESSKLLNEEIEYNLNALNSLSPIFSSMTGSGSTVFSVYETVELALWAVSKLKKEFGDRVELLKSFDPNERSFLESLFHKT